MERGKEGEDNIWDINIYIYKYVCIRYIYIHKAKNTTRRVVSQAHSLFDSCATFSPATAPRVYYDTSIVFVYHTTAVSRNTRNVWIVTWISKRSFTHPKILAWCGIHIRIYIYIPGLFLPSQNIVSLYGRWWCRVPRAETKRPQRHTQWLTGSDWLRAYE